MVRQLLLATAVSVSAGQSLNADVILKKHNVYRCMHGVAPLTWNSAIADQAQSWANTIQFDMRHGGTGPVAGFPGVGQNLWMWGGPVSWGPDLDVSSGVDSWYSEIAENVGQLDHFTQVVWKDTTDLGCAIWHGNRGDTETVQLVCDYGPYGNVQGGYDSNVLPLNGKSKSQCEAELDGGSFDIINPHTNKCLDVAGGSTSNGANVQLWECNGSGAQKWRLDNGKLRNVQANKCLDIDGFSKENGANLQIWECYGGWNQLWEFTAGWDIVNAGANKCLGIANYGTDNGANIRMWSCVGIWNQKWTRSGTASQLMMV